MSLSAREKSFLINSLDRLPPGLLDRRGPDDLHNEDEGDGQQAPEGHTDHNGHWSPTAHCTGVSEPGHRRRIL